MKTRSGKVYKKNARKTLNLNKLPQNFMVNLSRLLTNSQLGSLLLADPRGRMHNTLARERRLRNIRFRLPLMHLINRNYINLANNYARIAPNNNNAQYHKRRVNNMRNRLARMVLQNNGFYHNGNNRYNFNNGNLVYVPRNPMGVYITVARNVRRNQNGRLSF